MATAARTDVFVSYARENRAEAERLADALAGRRLVVWWDRDLEAGSEFSEVIELQLAQASVVVGLWSQASVRSAFVRDECGRALKADKLVPVRIEEVELPLGFGQVHTLDLLSWDGDEEDAAFVALLAEIGRRRGRPVPPPDERRFKVSWREVRATAWIAVVVAAVATGLWQVQGYIARKEEAQKAAELAARQALDRKEADRYFRAGLDFQYAAPPRLENALNEYLSALDRMPAHARARYYLGHVYAQSGRLADALVTFKLALEATDAKLDRAQLEDLRHQVALLDVASNEKAPVARSAATGTVTKRPVDMAANRLEPNRRAPRSDTAPLPPPPAPAAVVATRDPGTAASAAPARIAPPAQAQERLARAVAGLFDADRDRRISATTSLVVDPDDLSDAIPVAIERALQALAAKPLDQAAASGVVNTLVLLNSAMPSTLNQHRDRIAQLLDEASATGDTTKAQAARVRARLQQAGPRRPVLYLQIAGESQRPAAERIAERARENGYDVPPIEPVGARAPAHAELRVQGASERAFSRWIQKVVGETNGGTPPTVEVLRNARPVVDTYEVWLGKDTLG